MHPRSRSVIYRAYSAVTDIFHLDVTLFLSQHEGTLATLIHTLCCFDRISFQRLPLSQVTYKFPERNNVVLVSETENTWPRK